MRGLLILSLLVSYTLASSAKAAASVEACVAGSEDVSTLTSYFSVEGTSSDIDGVCDGLQMIRVDAMAHSAFMVEFLTFWNRPHKNQVSGDVCSHVSSVVKSGPITLLRGGSLPEPATGGSLYLSPKGVIHPKLRSLGVVALPTTEFGVLFLWSELDKANGTFFAWEYSRSSNLHTRKILSQ